jgi:hypothetical protein
MEKRNFVTQIRTSSVSDIGDSLVDTASTLFGGKNQKKADDFTKKAAAEDEKSDSLG